MELLRLDRNISLSEISFMGGMEGDFMLRHMPKERARGSREVLCLPSTHAAPWQILEGSQAPRMWAEDSLATAVDSAISRFPGLSASVLYLPLSALQKHKHWSLRECGTYLFLAQG